MLTKWQVVRLRSKKRTCSLGRGQNSLTLPFAYDDLLPGDREWGEDLFLLEEEEDEELSSDCSSLTRHSTSPDR
jgi:hypothetical protein